MKFIQCFDLKLKDELIQNGFRLLSSQGNLFIFENNPTITFNFNEIDKSKFTFTNKLMF